MSLVPNWRDPDFLCSKMKDHACPGLSLAMIQDFQIQWQVQLGFKSLATRQPVTASTLFQAASISKPVFALALMRLVEQERMKLDEDVSAYLKSWSLPPGSQKITLRQLLNHSAATTVSGFPGYEPGQTLPTLDQILDGLAPANTPAIRIEGEPGVRFSYSGGGITIAQKAFLDLSQGEFPELMQDMIFRPLGLEESFFEQPLNSRRISDSAAGHIGKEPMPGGWHVYPELAAAGLWISAQDLANLGIAVMKRHEGMDSPLALRQATVQEMLQPRLKGQGWDGASVGIGWFCSGANKDLSFGHNGGNEGYVAQACFRPSDGSGLVMLANGSEAFPLLTELMDAHGFSRSLL